MECCLCELWARMPYQKRHTTPTTAQDTEGALIVGYWLRRSLDNTVPRICERHMTILSLLDQQEEARIAAEEAAAIAVQQQKVAINPTEVARYVQVLAPNPATIQQQQIAAIQGHQQQLIDNLPKPPPPAPFTLGPGPLLNENAISPQPPLPVAPNPIEAYQQNQNPQSLLDELVKTNAAHAVTPVATAIKTIEIGTAAGALEAAKMPPVEGQKVTHPCPSCGVLITTGEVHAC